MDKKLSRLFCLLTVVIVGSLVFINNLTIDFPTIFLALKLTVPAGFIAYVCGFYLGKTLEQSKGDTKLFNVNSQKQFVDDLLLRPEDVLTSSAFIQPQNITNKDEQEEELPEDTQEIE